MINLLAKAIAEANKDRQAYVMQDTKTGLYLGYNFNMVKTKRIAMRVVIDDPQFFKNSVPTWLGVKVSDLKTIKYNRRK